MTLSVAFGKKSALLSCAYFRIGCLLTWRLVVFLLQEGIISLVPHEQKKVRLSLVTIFKFLFGTSYSVHYISETELEHYILRLEWLFK